MGSSEVVAPDVLKQCLNTIDIGSDLGVELAPVSAKVRPIARVGPMMTEPMIAEPIVVGPAQIAEPIVVGPAQIADVVRGPAQIVELDIGVDVVAEPAMEEEPAQLVELDVGVDVVAEAAMEVEPAQIVVGVDPEMVAEPAMVAEPVVVIGPAVYNIGNDPDIILMENQEQQPVDLGDSDIEVLGEYENPRQRLMHYRQTQTRQI